MSQAIFNKGSYSSRGIHTKDGEVLIFFRALENLLKNFKHFPETLSMLAALEVLICFKSLQQLNFLILGPRMF